MAWACVWETAKEISSRQGPILWTQSLGFTRIIYETDCKVATYCFSKCTKGSTYFHVIINKCNDLIPPTSNSRVSFVKRQTNLIAHNLARVSRFYVSSHVFYYIHFVLFHMLWMKWYNFIPSKKKKVRLSLSLRDDNGTGWGRVWLFHPYAHKKQGRFGHKRCRIKIWIFIPKTRE